MNESTVAEKAISESSYVRLGFAILIGGYIGLTSWWASGIQSKLDLLLSGQNSTLADHVSLQKRIDVIEKQNEIFEKFGSSALRARLDVLEKEVDQVRLKIKNP